MKDFVKVVVTVPPDKADMLRRVIGEAGGGQLGEYSFCSYSILGTGRFLPSDTANPAIGTPGQAE